LNYYRDQTSSNISR